jgi:very-short-patch-repair endonuclease
MGAPMFGYIVDALFVNERVIVELDSRPFHMDAIAFETDRERDAVMLSHGYVTVRITEERMKQRPQPEAKRLHAILAQRRTGHTPRAA